MSAVLSPSPRYALLSVWDKANLIPFAQRLEALGFVLLSTGGTARVLRDAGVQVTDVSDHTRSPELLDGRVKTLHPRIHAAILARRELPDHMAQLEQHQLPPIDLVVTNLYPFVAVTSSTPDLPMHDAVEQIDIGGPTMVRAAAKNHQDVIVVVDPADYDEVASTLERDGGLEHEARQRLALKAFSHTADYDAAIVSFLSARFEPAHDPQQLPAKLTLALERQEALRYGENPHQLAGLYTRAGQTPWGGAKVLGGKALSYNNLVDADAAIELVYEFELPAVAIIKHTNPAGAANDLHSIEAAYEAALACDAKSAFGGIVALNRPVSLALAERMAEHFYEVIAAPSFEPDALELLSKKKALRLIELPDAAQAPSELAMTLRQTRFGVLLQQQDLPQADLGWQVVTRAQPDEATERALRFAWRVCKHVKSNAIVLAQDLATIGIGAGQMSRVDAVELATRKSLTSTQGAVLASDAFFPFRDGVDEAARAGVRAIIQPGGSKRDEEVIAACDEHQIAMVMTGRRHFRH